MLKNIPIINKGLSPATKGASKMRRRKKRKNPGAGSKAYSPRKSAKRVAAGKKAARTRKRLAAKRASSLYKKSKGRKRRMTVKVSRRGLIRSPRGIGYRNGRKVRVNPSRRRRRNVRKNPVAMLKQQIRSFRLNQAIPMLVGLSGAVALKPFATRSVIPNLPVGIRELTTKWFGVVTMILGGTLITKGRRKMVKNAGMGMIVGGLYDIIATNFADLPFIDKYLPGISPTASPAPAAETTQGLGASIGSGSNFDVVGAANLTTGVEPDVVGEMELDDLL
jgi:hypothetical protein